MSTDYIFYEIGRILFGEVGTLIGIAPPDCLDNIGARYHCTAQFSSVEIDELIVYSFNDLRLLRACHTTDYSESAARFVNRSLNLKPGLEAG